MSLLFFFMWLLDKIAVNICWAMWIGKGNKVKNNDKKV